MQELVALRTLHALRKILQKTLALRTLRN